MRRRNVFQGDSHVLYEKNVNLKNRIDKLEALRDYNEGLPNTNTRFTIPGGVPMKYIGNARDYELMRNSKAPITRMELETLEGKVDLKKIKSIRRALRRRYANRRKV